MTANDADGSSDTVLTPRLFLIIVLGVSLLVRLYLLYETSNQPVWWDEANYLVKAKSIALGLPDTGYDSGRPILFSIFLAPFFALGLGEIGIRIAMSATSLLSVYLLYKVGARLANPWVGIVAAALFSSHYLNLFFTQRIMCEIPYVTFALLALVFFLSDNRKLVWASGPMFAVSVMLRYPAFMIPLSVLLFVLLTERSRSFRRLDYWICLGLAILSVAPDLLVRGSDTIQATSWILKPQSSEEKISNLWKTVQVFLELWDPVSQIVLIVGLILAGWYILNPKSPREPRRCHLLLILLILGPMLLQGLWISHLEDRYLYGCMPAACLLMASVYRHVARLSLHRERKSIVAISVACLLCTCGLMVYRSAGYVSAKLTSYGELRRAGLWLKSRNDQSAIVLSQSVAQLTYYSEMSGASLPQQLESLPGLMANSKVKYVVISGLEAHPDWINDLDSQATGLHVVMTYPRVEPVLLILERPD